MRVVPHAILSAEQDESTNLLKDIDLDGISTHGHPRALIGARVYGYATWLLLRRTTTLGFGELVDELTSTTSDWGRPPTSKNGIQDALEIGSMVYGRPYHELWQQTTQEMLHLLEQCNKGILDGALSNDHKILENLGCLGREYGSGTINAAAAVYLASRHASNPRQGILLAAFERGLDTDTLAAMVGGLIGALVGRERLPQVWSHVQDANYIRTVASQLVDKDQRTSGAGELDFAKAISAQNRLRLFKRQLLTIEHSGLVDWVDRSAQAERLQDPIPLAKNIKVCSWGLTTPEGQTLYINDVKNIRPRS